MPGKSLIANERSGIAQTIVNMYDRFQSARMSWLERGAEARRYVTAPDTSYTEAGALPWKNKTTIPKLTQIADNLHAYYMAALMPNDEWFVFEGSDPESRKKAQYVEAYMRAKLRMSGFREQLEKCVRDWIIYGNCFGGVTWVKRQKWDFVRNENVIGYQGPALFRISPLDALMDPTAPDFDSSPFIYRRWVSVADIILHNEMHQVPPYDPEAVEAIRNLRNNGSLRQDWVDFYHEEGLYIDGFASADEYLDSQMVEIIEYMGDVIDPDTGEIQTDRIITIADRTWILRNVPNPSLNHYRPVAHSAWRVLPDNLYGQGPLDNLVVMQYRCDHLENLKADGFDQIVHPPVKIKGDMVEDFVWAPGAQIYCGADGDVEVLSPDTTLLQADNQIQLYHMYMELMAGSPRESMGFRTPGEKTAFEVQVLQQGADRMFLDKVNHFEAFVERILNIMFEMMVRNVDEEDIARTFNADPEALEVLGSISPEDVVANGTIRPVGSKHYAARIKRVQELSNFLQLASALPSLSVHVSGLRAAEMFEEELGLDKWNIVEQFAGLKEQMQTQLQAAALQTQMQQVMQQLGVQPPTPEGEVA